MENVSVRRIPATAVGIIVKDPDPSCPQCKGKGTIRGLICSCRCVFGSEEKVSLLVAFEQKEDGSLELDFEEEGKRRKEEVES